ncbi:hypothetical protein, partial [Aeromicrobium sp.]|uniref:hypothetical protein n=1 Tax=Aeromicrobium sp. TaxID=1871063 RepID=UPI003C70203A
MRRSLPFSAIIIGLLLALVSPTSASAATSYPAGSSSGVFSISPSTFADGDTVTLSANFASNQKGAKVTFYRSDVVPDGETFEPIGTQTANTNGNAYLKGYAVSGNQVLFALTSKGEKTNRKTIDSAAAPSTCPVAGALSSSPQIVTPDSTVSIFANFASDQQGKDITLYQVVDGVDPDAAIGNSQKADQYGNATFSVEVGTTKMVIRAETSPGSAKCTKPIEIVPQEIDPASFPEQGPFSVNPADVRLGEQGKLIANFASSFKGKTVTFFHKVPGSSGSPDTWESIGSASANSSG